MPHEMPLMKWNRAVPARQLNLSIIAWQITVFKGIIEVLWPYRVFVFFITLNVSLRKKHTLFT